MRLRSLLLHAALIAFPLVAVADESPLRIATIAIRTVDVYTPGEASRGWPYRAANRLHVQTRPSVIRSFLLFREGDRYEPELLAETERNLRALSFLKSARVEAGLPHDGVVDVTVTTQDAWSIDAGTQAGRRGGGNTYGADIRDANIAGTGKEVSFSYSKGVDRSQMSLDYNDPAFFAAYWRGHFSYAMNSDGYERRVTLLRPFFSFATPWATSFSYHGFRQNDRLWDQGVQIGKFSQEHRQFIVDAGMAIDPNNERARRVTVGFRWTDDNFASVRTNPGDALPAEREFHYLFIRYQTELNDFLTLDYVNKDLRYEDFNLGRSDSVEAGISPRSLGGDALTGFVRAARTEGWRFGPQSFLLPSVSFETRLNHGVSNAIAAADVQYVQRYATEHPQALVGRLVVHYGWRVDREVQFLADGTDGLRGYPAHSFAGTRNIIANLEQRIYLGREMGQLISPAIVAFVDTGMATNGSLTRLLDLKTDAGVGIRIGLPRTSRNLLRIDFAYPLQRDPRGRRGLLVSFSSGQAF
jgi:hypothetical protein